MLRKIRLKSVLFIAAVLLAHQQFTAQEKCATGAPPQKWDNWFNAEVEEQSKKMAGGKSQVVARTIPVIVHIIHYGEPHSTFPNIDSLQVISQIEALNKDFSGQGDGINNIPSQFSPHASNTGIEFCRATVDYSGTAMVEQGINRVNAGANSWDSPASPTLNLQQYFNDVIIPSTIWDPAKYFNIWVSDRPAGSDMTSFGTYPPASGLIGISGGNLGTATNDGIWVYARAFGTVGDIQAPTDKGRTATHQTGHWLGLRHTWGDGNCLSDYVKDTPTQKGPTSGCPSGLTTPDICGVNLSPNGNMYMNFMDETDDACKYMFTHDQALRMHTALSQSPQRNLLGTHGQCQALNAPPTSSAVASFVLVGNPCVNSPFTPSNTSSGFPHPSYLWSSSPPAIFQPNNTSSHPFITFNTPGTYIITLAATNSVATSSYSMKVSAQFTCDPENICLDSLRMIKNTDSLTVYNAPENNQVANCGQGPTGYMAGTNCYQDKEFAQYFPPTTYSNILYPQVNSVIVLFDSAGTNGSGSVVCRIYGGTSGSGPAGSMGTPKSEAVSVIASGTKLDAVSYMGISGATIPGRQIIPYKFDFDKPITITSPASGFFTGIEIPPGIAGSVNIITDTRLNSSTDSSSWFRNYFGTWKTIRHDRGAKLHLAIIPQISCSILTGIEEIGFLNEKNIKLMPNPGSGEFSLLLNFAREEHNISVRVYSYIGKEILATDLGTVSTHLLQLNLNEQPQGVYFVEISSGKQKLVKKLILQR